MSIIFLLVLQKYIFFLLRQRAVFLVKPFQVQLLIVQQKKKVEINIFVAGIKKRVYDYFGRCSDYIATATGNMGNSSLKTTDSKCVKS